MFTNDSDSPIPKFNKRLVERRMASHREAIHRTRWQGLVAEMTPRVLPTVLLPRSCGADRT
jgi:hypothetical protein